MSRKRVLLDRPMLDPAGTALLAGEVEIVAGWELTPKARAEVLSSVHGLGAGGTRSDVEGGSSLEVIASYGSGVEHIDVRAATDAGIIVVNAAGVHRTAVAEHGIGLMLAFARRIAYTDRILHTEQRFVRHRELTGDGWPGWPTQLHGKVLGVVGFGHIGRDLAQKCRLAFAMEVLAHSPRADPDEVARQHVALVSLDQLLARSDYVCLCVPLTDDTRAMVGAPELARMKRSSVLVNLSRGPTVDTSALLDALRDGTIRGAALDVLDPEPLPAGHPLYALDNVVLTPHIGGWVIDAMEQLSLATAQDLLRALRGERPSRFVNPGVWATARVRTGRSAGGDRDPGAS